MPSRRVDVSEGLSLPRLLICIARLSLALGCAASIDVTASAIASRKNVTPAGTRIPKQLDRNTLLARNLLARTSLAGARGAAFIENRGQFDPRVRFQVRVRDKILWLTNTGIVFDVTRGQQSPGAGTSDYSSPSAGAGFAGSMFQEGQATATRKFERLVFAEEFIAADGEPVIEVGRPREESFNYFKGEDPGGWRARVLGYCEITYRDVWRGIDVRFSFDGRDVAQEFVVHPGADLRRVKVRYQGIERLGLAEDGSLIINTRFGHLRETRPLIYQEVGGRRLSVRGKFTLLDATSYSFSIKSYRPGYPLVIDPTLLYSTYLGGSREDFGTSIAADATGAAYITGWSRSSDFPTTTGSFQTTAPGSGFDTFVTKLSPSGELVYSTFLGGAQARAIGVNAAGEAYITGTTVQSFPTTANAYQTGCNYSAFLTKLNTAGDALLYSTCIGAEGFGGATGDAGSYALAVDSAGNAYLTGYTGGGFPVTPNAVQPTRRSRYIDAFLAVIDPAKSQSSSLLYSTYLGGSDDDRGYAVAVDASGNAYVGGWARGPGLPITDNAFQKDYRSVNGNCPNNGFPVTESCGNAFIAKINPKASGPSGLLYSSYLGGAGNAFHAGDSINAIAVDLQGNAYVAGTTGSPDFPTTPGSFQSTPFLCPNQGFVTKVNADGSTLLYSTHLRGTENVGNCEINISGIALDSSGNAYVTGGTRSDNFPVTPDAFQDTLHGGGALGFDAFLTKLNSTGSGLLYSTYLGGSGEDNGASVAVDATGDVYVTGWTSSPDFPTTPGALQSTSGTVTYGREDAFITKFPFGNAVRPFRVAEFTPHRGGNAGTVTMTVYGSGFRAGVSLKLKSAGYPDVVASPVFIGPGGLTLDATLDLHDAAPGVRDVVVTNPDGASALILGGFTLEQGGTTDIWVDVTGRTKLRSGSARTYYISFGNRGSIDAAVVNVWIAFPNFLKWDLGFSNTDSQLVSVGQIDSEIVVSIRKTLLASGASIVLPVKLTAPNDPQYAHRSIHIRGWVKSR
jgi:beta-propeller repeat-containing protein